MEANPDPYRNYPQFPELSDAMDQELEDMIEAGSWEMGNLYVLADRCEVPTLRRATIDRLHQVTTLQKERHPTKYAKLCSFAGVTHAMRNLPITSPLCRLLVDTFVDFYSPDDEGEKCPTEILLLRQKLPLEFVFAIMQNMASIHRPIGLHPRCAYHEHPQDMPSKDKCRKVDMESVKKRKRDIDDEDNSC